MFILLSGYTSQISQVAIDTGVKEYYGKDLTEARVTAKSMLHSYDTFCRNYYKTNFDSFIDGIHYINKATGQMPEGSIMIDPKSKAANLIP